MPGSPGTARALLLALCCACARAAATYDLGSLGGRAQWTLRNENKSISVSAEVPGGVYSDLMRAGVLPDVLAGLHDESSRWVAMNTWTYTGIFNLSEEALTSGVAHLVFEGLDTVAYVELNGLPVVAADNMFTRYSTPVAQMLKEGKNVIKVTFDSPVLIARNRSEKHLTPPKCVPESYHGECHVNQLRKMQASFGWDWGIALPSVGIWKAVYIESINPAVIRYVRAHTTELGDKWQVQLNVTMETAENNRGVVIGYLEAAITVDSKATVTVGKLVSVRPASYGTVELNITVNLSKNVVSLWWPNGLGEQPLYPVRVTFTSGDASEGSSKLIHIGFRTIELVQENATNYLNGKATATAQKGLVYFFRINGYNMFMKGTNWIPMSILPELTANKKQIDHLLESAKEAHMTMLRVWGGGIYESDYFYSKCDQLGILVWQDFMFACSMYPVDTKFLRSVATEVKQNVLRLQHHASIALWAGNNENEAALSGNWYNTGHAFSQYKNEYIQLYVNTVKRIVESLDPTRHFEVSSPSNGKQSEKEGFIAKHPYDSHYGDTHFYNYLVDTWSMNVFPFTRFASEYGFQSMPSMETWRTATNRSKDLKWESDFLNHRQHLPGGNALLKSAIDLHFVLPISDPDYFTKFVFYSQIAQAMSLKAETEYYRQTRADWYTMGALYWQLNDVWQAPSWSSVEFNGRWKMSHYFARRFFSPVLVSPRLLASGDIDVYIINDMLISQSNALMAIDLFRYDSITPIHSELHTVSMGPLDVLKTDVSFSALDIKHNRSIFYRFSLRSSEGRDISPYNYVFPVNFKFVSDIKIPNIKISVKEGQISEYEGVTGRRIFEVTITSDAVVLFLWLEAEGAPGRFTDNGFVVTQPQSHVGFVTNLEIDAASLQKIITCQYYHHPTELTANQVLSEASKH